MTTDEEIIEEIYYLEYSELCNRCNKEHKFFIFDTIDKAHGVRRCCIDCYKLDLIKKAREDEQKRILEIIDKLKEPYVKYPSNDDYIIEVEKLKQEISKNELQS